MSKNHTADCKRDDCELHGECELATLRAHVAELEAKLAEARGALDKLNGPWGARTGIPSRDDCEDPWVCCVHSPEKETP